MKIVFWHSDKPRESILASAFADGARNFGDEVETRPLTPEHEAVPCDVACMVGVKSKELYQSNWRQGSHTVYFDKGYTRHAAPGPVKLWEYWRVAVDGHHPTGKLMVTKRPSDRLEKLELTIKPWRVSGKHIVLAGSSEKYHDFYGMKDPTRYAQKVVNELKLRAHRKIIYRPKPSWKGAVAIEGSAFSNEGQIEDYLKGAHALVTHGSNACFEAVCHGVPCIILGEAVAKPISSLLLDDIEAPKMVSEKERMQWLSNLAYCQWTLQELHSGEAWKYLRPQIYG